MTVNGVSLAFPDPFGEDSKKKEERVGEDEEEKKRSRRKRHHDEQMAAGEEEDEPEPEAKRPPVLFSTSTSRNVVHHDRVIGVPLDNRKGRPPKTPEARDYRLMQALRYFDMHRLGLIRGEDLEIIFLTLGVDQITGRVATELAACADSTLPHKPFLLTNYESFKTIRYKPICDWLKNVVTY